MIRTRRSDYEKLTTADIQAAAGLIAGEQPLRVVVRPEFVPKS